VEQEGIRRALARAEDADLVLWVIDATDPVWAPPAPLAAKDVVFALNKSDRGVPPAHINAVKNPLVLSAKTGAGLDALIGRLADLASAESAGSGHISLTRTRHRTELVSSRDALQRFVNHDLSPELKAEELRIAARHLGRLTGLIDVEEVLGAIFAEFCIGK
jgi:tRNA modification GTPase